MTPEFARGAYLARRDDLGIADFIHGSRIFHAKMAEMKFSCNRL